MKGGGGCTKNEHTVLCTANMTIRHRVESIGETSMLMAGRSNTRRLQAYNAIEDLGNGHYGLEV